MKTRNVCVAIVTVGLLAATAGAAPSLDIRKPSQGGEVLPEPSWTGPVGDPHAAAGQWFRSVEEDPEFPDTYVHEARSHEFYDNVMLDGGGLSNWWAIQGIAQNLQYTDVGGTLYLISFEILAVITNDTPGVGTWDPGTNRHGESLATTNQYTGTLLLPKLTAEFAIDDDAFHAWRGDPPHPMTGPYRDEDDPRIVAENHDQLAWYCWTPGNGQNLTPYGDYLVPTWDFDDIPVGESRDRILEFRVEGDGLDIMDPRRMALEESEGYQRDLFLNRTRDLKIGDWIDTLEIDGQANYQEPNPWRSGNVSVFHNIPEPGTVMLAIPIVAAMATWRRLRALKG